MTRARELAARVAWALLILAAFVSLAVTCLVIALSVVYALG